MLRDIRSYKVKSELILCSTIWKKKCIHLWTSKPIFQQYLAFRIQDLKYQIYLHLVFCSSPGAVLFFMQYVFIEAGNRIFRSSQKQSLAQSETYPRVCQHSHGTYSTKLFGKYTKKYEGSLNKHKHSWTHWLCSTDSGKIYHFCAWGSLFIKWSVIYISHSDSIWVHVLTYMNDLVYSLTGGCIV